MRRIIDLEDHALDFILDLIVVVIFVFGFDFSRDERAAVHHFGIDFDDLAGLDT